MKAAVMEAVGAALIIQDIEIAPPIGNEVLVDVRASGLCHSDLHVIENGMGMKPPVVLGHELAGVVTGIGPSVTEFSVGDHVVGCLLSHCGRCRECLAGRIYRCQVRQATMRGSDEPPRLSRGGEPVLQGFDLGGFAEQALVHERNLVRVDPAIPFQTACLLGCAVITGAGAVFNSAAVAVGDSVAIIGCGGVGLSAIQAARLAGARQIFAVDIHENKLAMAQKLGATDLINAATCDPVETIKRLAGGVDHAFETAGRSSTAMQAFQMLAMGGTAYLIGLQEPGSTLNIPGNSFLMAQTGIRGVVMGSSNFKIDIPILCDYMLQGRLILDDLVSQTIALDDINEGYRTLMGGDVARSVITS